MVITKKQLIVLIEILGRVVSNKIQVGLYSHEQLKNLHDIIVEQQSGALFDISDEE